MAQPTKRLGAGSAVGGRYTLGALLGDGAMGRVYRARDEQTGRDVALKLVHRHLAMHAQLVERFKREMTITRTLKHPTVVRVLDVGSTENGVPFLVMELISGQSLDAILQRTGPLEPLFAADVGAQIADALACAHEASFVHRDVKPENIMLTGSRLDRVKVLDFGISRVVGSFEEGPMHGEEGFRTLTRANAAIGTPTYMSPEQAACETIGPQSDLYSLGMVLYELVAGMPPFICATHHEALKKHMREKPVPLGEKVPEAPDWLEAVVMQLLEKEPKDRPATARDVAEALRDGLGVSQPGYEPEPESEVALEPVVVTPPPPPLSRQKTMVYTPSTSAPRWPFYMGGLTALIVGVVALLYLSMS